MSAAYWSSNASIWPWLRHVHIEQDAVDAEVDQPLHFDSGCRLTVIEARPVDRHRQPSRFAPCPIASLPQRLQARS